jgi:hypothetical protein
VWNFPDIQSKVNNERQGQVKDSGPECEESPGEEGNGEPAKKKLKTQVSE